MALDAETLAGKIKNKVKAKNPDMGHIIDPDEGEATGSLDWLFESIAEAVVEHISNKAEVTIVVVGADGGSSLPPAIQNKLGKRDENWDAPPPSPDSGLQNDSTAAPTLPAATSVALSLKGLID